MGHHNMVWAHCVILCGADFRSFQLESHWRRCSMEVAAIVLGLAALGGLTLAAIRLSGTPHPDVDRTRARGSRGDWTDSISPMQPQPTRHRAARPNRTRSTCARRRQGSNDLPWLPYEAVSATHSICPGPWPPFHNRLRAFAGSDFPGRFLSSSFALFASKFCRGLWQ